jgi:cellobiose dehydrogenase (acceptor)
MAITAQLSTVVAEHPYLHTAGDKEAVLKSLDNLRAALTPVKNLTWALPLANQTTADYVNSLVVSAAARRSNHWMGKPSFFPTIESSCLTPP